MNLFGRTSNIRWAPVMLVLYILFSAALFFVYYFCDLPEKMGVIVSGVSAGAFIALVQFLWEWSESNRVYNLKAMKVRDVLMTRDNEGYYRKMIAEAKREVVVLGVTAKRFLEDFADADSPLAEKRVLLTALARGVSVKMLVAAKEHLPTTGQAEEGKFEYAKRRMAELKLQHPNHFDYGCYEHLPAHSLVMVDDSCIIGPCFPYKESKHTPAIRMDRDSQFAASYLEYFAREWAAKTIP